MIATLNKIGKGHNSCQDNLFVEEDEDYIWGACCDGCSSGYKAEFASQLFIYLLQHQGKVAITNSSLYLFRWRLVDMYNLISMPSIHALSTTMLLFLYRKKTKILEVRCFGDGYYRVNDQEFMIDQSNTPDYFGFHIHEEFDTFKRYIDKNPIQLYGNVSSFQICSDGIHSIHLPQFKEDPGIEPKSFLLDAKGSANILERKFNILKNKGFEIHDDLSIISYYGTDNT